MYTVAEQIQIAKICVPLTVKAIATGAEKDKRLARKLYIGWNTVNDVYVDTPTSTDLPLMANYLFAMCGGYAFQAESYLGLVGGNIVNPITGAPATLKYIGETFTFIVGDATTSPLLNAGGTVFVIPLGVGSYFDDSVTSSFTLSMDQTPLPRNKNAAIQSNYACWDISFNLTTGNLTVTLSQAAQNSQLYIPGGTYFTP